MPNYDYLEIKAEILGDNIDAPTSIRTFINRAARNVYSDLDLRSAKRSSQLSPQLFREVYDYGSPSDLKGWALVDLKRQVQRTKDQRYEITTNEQFDSWKARHKNLLTIADASFIQKLRISANIDSTELVIHQMDSITADGTWIASSDASNLTLDSGNFLNGSASLNFDVAVNFTSAILENSTMNSVDLTDYEGQSLFIWLYIPAIDGISSVKLRWGSSSGDYWEATATTTNEGTSFYVGWNLIRFSWPATDTGTPVITTVDYLRLQVVGDGSSSASTDWRADYIVARSGVIHDVVYYTKYPWQTSAGVYIANSTADTDLLNVDEEELELITLKGKQILFEEDRMFDEAKRMLELYEIAKTKYIDNYPSERLLIIQTYEEFETLDGEE